MIDLANKWSKAVNRTGGDSRIFSGMSKAAAVPQVGAGLVGAIDLGTDAYTGLSGAAQRFMPSIMGGLREPEGFETVLRGE